MSDRGSAVVEFALVLPVVLVVMLGVVEVAVVARAQLEVSQAAREGVREAATNPDTEAAVGVVHGFLKTDRARVAVSREHRVGGRAEVTVRLRHTVAAPLLGGFDIILVGRSTMRVER